MADRSNFCDAERHLYCIRNEIRKEGGKQNQSVLMAV